MPISAGLLMCRIEHGALEFFLVHPGGPFFARKNEGFWGIPKGLVEVEEELEDAARREFFEETGIRPTGPLAPLDSVKLKSGKLVHAWAFLGSWDDSTPIVSNKIDLTWPPGSGKTISVPEIDKAEWMPMQRAKVMMTKAQVPFLDRAATLFDK